MGSAQSLYEGPLPPFTVHPETQDAAHGPAHTADEDSPYQSYMTLYTGLMERRRVDDGSRPIYGTRKVDPATGVMGEYQWLTYDEFLTQVDALASGMVHCLQTQRQECIGVFSKNRYEWSLVEHGCNRMAFKLVPLYDTLGPHAIPFILNHTDMRIVFCDPAQFDALMKALPECPALQAIVQFEELKPGQAKQAEAAGVQVWSLQQVLDAGTQHPVPADPPLPSDVSTICYTSGTTSNPKGAVLTHANMMSAAWSVQPRLQFNRDDVHLSFLPLAHIMERTIETCLVMIGAQIAFSQGNVATLMEDIAHLRPTEFCAVPRLLNRVHDQILANVASAGGTKKWLFETALTSKTHYLKQGYVTHAFWDALIFNKVKQVLGGRVRFIMNGSAPIARDCKELLQVAFCCPVLEGYGMTETCAATCITTKRYPPGGHVGLPLPGMEICLADVPEMDYTNADKPLPRGEICIRGPQIFQGYYKEPEKTAQAIDSQGWFHSEDIAQWNEDGTLQIIDRKKNIFKLSQGEYVAPERIENIYVKSTAIAQIFVHGNSLKNHLIAIVVPDPATVAMMTKTQGDAAPEMLKQRILQDMDALATQYGLCGFERVNKIHLHYEPFAVEQELVTPTFKLKRRPLQDYFRAELEALYEE